MHQAERVKSLAGRMNVLKRTMYLAGGLCWLAFAAGFGFFVLQFLVQGAGMQFLDTSVFSFSVASGTVLLGLVWLTGLVIATLVCCVVSVWLFARGLAFQNHA
jgi:hypothetical protein